MSTVITLPPDLTIYKVGELRSQWLGCINEELAANGAASPTWIGDASSISDIDGAGLQLLLALAQTLSAQHGTLHLENPSPRLTDACATFGVTSLLCDPTDAST